MNITIDADDFNLMAESFFTAYAEGVLGRDITNQDITDASRFVNGLRVSLESWRPFTDEETAARKMFVRLAGGL